MIIKFTKGDHVRIGELPPHKSHFQGNCEAIVLGSYADNYGGNDKYDIQYSVYIKGRGCCAWYNHSELTLIEAGKTDLLNEWILEIDTENEIKSDLDWIFSHGNEVLANPVHASLQALATCIGCTNLWGISGEGITYAMNAQAVLVMAYPYLTKGDKQGWLKLGMEYQK
jgi:hypothetical protein